MHLMGSPMGQSSNSTESSSASTGIMAHTTLSSCRGPGSSRSDARWRKGWRQRRPMKRTATRMYGVLRGHGPRGARAPSLLECRLTHCFPCTEDDEQPLPKEGASTTQGVRGPLRHSTACREIRVLPETAGI